MELTTAQPTRASHDDSRHLPQPSHTPPSEVGHWVRTAGILSPLIIGEIVKDPEKKWRFIRITSVAVALISEGLHAHRIQRERREREAERQR
jgi:hypothetical protein